MDTLANRIRAAAKKAGGIEKLRIQAKLSGGAFYGLLRGEAPKTMKVIGKLEAVGIKIPRSTFRKAA